ncbi:NHL repeat-containing protein [Solimonas flava]|uniref:NHL repeat-containing protein n=1 Tax=Solimonas flava TaxID=415849 RepID=UPI0012B649A4|nr:NHL repeat-containing protein [Solimonas flava]
MRFSRVSPTFPSVTRKSLSKPALLKPALAATVAVLLAACGGGGGGNKKNLEEAYTVVGQADFKTGTAASPSASTLRSPQSNVATNGTKFAVADASNNRILIWNSIPSSNGAAASVVLGQADFSTRTAATTQAGLNSPQSVFISNEDKLVVADQGNHRVLIWNSIPTASNTPADVVVGQDSFTAKQVDLDGVDGKPSARGLDGPYDAIVTADGKLIVADTNNNRVLIWNTLPTSNGQAANIVLGQVDFTSDDDDDEADAMNVPRGLWSDGAKLMVADSGNNRVLYWPNLPQTSTVKASYVVGQTDFSRNTAGTSASSLRNPVSVSSDGAGFYVADAGNNRVLRYDSLPSSKGMNADFVYGQDNDSFAASTANDENQDGKRDDNPSAKTLSGPTGAFVYDNNLYVTDSSNNRVLFFNPFATP